MTALLVAVLTVALAGCGGDEGGATTQSPTGIVVRAEPVKASADALRTVAGAVGHPLYWVPDQRPDTYELTQASEGKLYIRYLPSGVEIGDPRPAFLTVGTYPQADAFATVEAGARRDGATVARLPGGGLMVSQREQPTSAFFAYPDSPVLVEVFDPTAGRAAALITSGAVRPVV